MNIDDLKNLASSEKIADLKEKVSDVAHTVAEKAEQIEKSIANDKIKNLADKLGEGAKKVESMFDDVPGIAINKGDGGKVSEKLVDERTKALNNNPRNGDMKR